MANVRCEREMTRSSSLTKVLLSFNIQNTQESGQKSALKPPVIALKLEKKFLEPFRERILLGLEGKVGEGRGERRDEPGRGGVGNSSLLI